VRSSKVGRDKVIETAIDLFSAKGFSGASIRNIADAMGMSISNIYHYFGNKEGLLLAILDSSTTTLIEALQASTRDGDDPLERLKNLINTHIRLSRTFRKEMKIFFLDEEHLSPAGIRINADFQEKIMGLYRKELALLAEQGRLRGDHLVITMFNILAIINWQVRWFRFDGPITLDEVSAEIMDFIMHGMLME
jgi:AcrR family transcriptional regulator